VKLNISGVTFSYASTVLLKDVTMEIDAPEILGLVGPNGAGKSTLIRCIDRILKPQRGSILLGGRETKKMGRRELAKHLGYVPQATADGFPATVFDTVLMGRRPHISWGISDSDLGKVAEILKLLEIERFALRDFKSLSGGEKQRVFIARVFAQEPDVLLLDEPTSNLDIKYQLEVLEVTKNVVRKKRISAIIAIHDLNLAARYTDKIVMLKEGGVFAAGTPRAVLTPENIKSVYGVEARVIGDSGGLYVFPVRSCKDEDKNIV
jgi:iron complex transport system ATP-binding protein